MFLCCGFHSGQLRLDRGVEKTIAAFDQFFEPRSEASRRSTIDDIVIKTDRQAQIVPQSDVPINEYRLLTNAAHRNHQCWHGLRDAPTGALPKHAHGCDAHRPHELLPHLGISSPYQVESPEERSKEY